MQQTPSRRRIAEIMALERMGGLQHGMHPQNPGADAFNVQISPSHDASSVERDEWHSLDAQRRRTEARNRFNSLTGTHPKPDDDSR